MSVDVNLKLKDKEGRTAVEKAQSEKKPITESVLTGRTATLNGTPVEVDYDVVEMYHYLNQPTSAQYPPYPSNPNMPYGYPKYPPPHYPPQAGYPYAPPYPGVPYAPPTVISASTGILAPIGVHASTGQPTANAVSPPADAVPGSPVMTNPASPPDQVMHSPLVPPPPPGQSPPLGHVMHSSYPSPSPHLQQSGGFYPNYYGTQGSYPQKLPKDKKNKDKKYKKDKEKEKDKKEIIRSPGVKRRKKIKERRIKKLRMRIRTRKIVISKRVKCDPKEYPKKAQKKLQLLSKKPKKMMKKLSRKRHKAFWQFFIV